MYVCILLNNWHNKKTYKQSHIRDLNEDAFLDEMTIVRLLVPLKFPTVTFSLKFKGKF